jgi:hypothetical protein
MDTTLISQADIIKKTGYSRQQLTSFRLGGTVTVVNPTSQEGVKRKYSYETQPILKEGKEDDWFYNRGRVFFTEDGLEKILRHQKEKKRPEGVATITTNHA